MTLSRPHPTHSPAVTAVRKPRGRAGAVRPVPGPGPETSQAWLQERGCPRGKPSLDGWRRMERILTYRHAPILDFSPVSGKTALRVSPTPPAAPPPASSEACRPSVPCHPAPGYPRCPHFSAPWRAILQLEGSPALQAPGASATESARVTEVLGNRSLPEPKAPAPPKPDRGRAGSPGVPVPPPTGTPSERAQTLPALQAPGSWWRGHARSSRQEESLGQIQPIPNLPLVHMHIFYWGENASQRPSI